MLDVLHLSQITESVTASIMKTVTLASEGAGARGASKSKTPKRDEIVFDPACPNMEPLPALKASLESMKLPETIAAVTSGKMPETEFPTATLKIAPQPFSKDSERLAYLHGADHCWEPRQRGCQESKRRRRRSRRCFHVQSGLDTDVCSVAFL